MNSKTIFFNVFKNKTVFVTGHTGFIGCWLSLWLKKLGAHVIGYSLKPPTSPSFFETIKLREDITHIFGDVCDFRFLLSSIRDHKPDFIFHMAAQSLVGVSYEKPIETFQTNIIGSANVLEAIRQTGTKIAIIMTSDKCYENTQIGHAYKENDRLGGDDPYSASKAATEIVTNAYVKSFFHKNTEIATVRVGNVVGGGDWAEYRIVPDCIRYLTKNKKIKIRNPEFIRPWQYVLEPIYGILLLASKMFREPNKYSEPWNFGPQDYQNPIKVKDVVNLIIKKWGTGQWIDDSGNSKHFHESLSLMLNPTKAQKILGWHTIYNLDETISETIDWYVHFTQNTDMKKFSISQIENYIEKAKTKKSYLGK